MGFSVQIEKQYWWSLVRFWSVTFLACLSVFSLDQKCTQYPLNYLYGYLRILILEGELGLGDMDQKSYPDIFRLNIDI